MNSTKPTVRAASEATPCKICSKSFKNNLLHVVKTHKKFICAGCNEYKPVETAITECGGNNAGKICKNALCEDCWT